MGGSSSSSSAGDDRGGSSSSSRVSPQRRFIDEIKSKIKASRRHENGRIQRISEFPYNDGWASAPLPTLQRTCGKCKSLDWI